MTFKESCEANGYDNYPAEVLEVAERAWNAATLEERERCANLIELVWDRSDIAIAIRGNPK